MEYNETQYNPMQTVKRRFFAMRNGVVADVLRKAGSPYRIIFGLNLPQIVDIAGEIGPSRILAEELFGNTSTRESLLIAPMLMPHEEFSADDAMRWSMNVADREAADILCHRLLRHMPYALDLARELCGKEGLPGYVGIRLAVNLIYAHPSECAAIAAGLVDSSDAHVSRLAQQILEEVELIANL